jgi:hypothetical protein
MNKFNRYLSKMPIILIFFFTPLILFLQENYLYISFYEIIYLIISISFFYKIIKILDNRYKSQFIIFFAIFFNTLFLHQLLSLMTSKNLSYLILIFFNLLIFLIFKKKIKILKVMILVFIPFIILINYFLLEFDKYDFKNNLSLDDNDQLINDNYYKIKNNIYYVIFDGMTSLEYVEKYTDISKEKEILELKKYNLNYIKDSFSSYNQTPLSMGAIMLTNYHVDSGSLIFKDYDNFYPRMIYEYKNQKKFKNNLILILKKNDIKFIKVLHNWAKPNPKDISELSIDERESKFLKILFPLVFFKFYFNTPIDGIILKISKIFLDEINPSSDYIQNNAIERYAKYLKKNGKPKETTFTLIHTISPHRPFIYNPDCTYNRNGTYTDSYKCSLKRIKSFMKVIKNTDPEAIVVIQADHGWDVLGNKGNNFYISRDMFNIFNSIYAPNKCLDGNISFGLDNVNTLKLALACASNQEFLPIKQKHFYGYHFDGVTSENRDKVGKVFEIDLK